MEFISEKMILYVLMMNMEETKDIIYFFIIILGIIKRIKAKGIQVVTYKPVFTEDEFFHSKVIDDLKSFKQMSSVIVANRMVDELQDVKGKVYTRDLFNSD